MESKSMIFKSSSFVETVARGDDARLRAENSRV